MKRITLIFVLLLAILSNGYGQCSAGTPVYFVDLSSDPAASWVSPSIVRNGDCCLGVDPCVQFIVSLHPDAEGLVFSINSGAVPGGSLFYEVNCGDPIAIDSATCISGVGPHSLTFCKPGGNANTYRLTSAPAPSLGVDITIADGCVDTLKSEGFQSSSTFWRSIYPGTIGDYDSYLDCNIGCDMAIVTPQPGYPEFVDYQVCGFALSNCDTVGVCDTIRVYFQDSLEVEILPLEPKVCYGNSTTTITANIHGGEAPFSYSWSTGETTESIEVGPGTYSVIVNDAGNCYTVNTTVTVGQFLAGITADAGLDQLLCAQSPEVELNGTLTGVSTSYWKGGQGNFSTDSTDLNANYYPSLDEISIGYTDLWLMTTNNYNCPADSDLVHIEYREFFGEINSVIDPITCYNSNDAAISIAISNGYQNYSFAWDAPLSSMSASVSSLYPGTYSVLISDSLTCDTNLSFTLSEPAMLSIDSLNLSNVGCFGNENGNAEVFVSGGMAPYTYDWGVNANNQDSSVASNLSAGSYTISISDDHACTIDSSITISEPMPLNLVLDSSQDVLCFDENNGEASVSANGGSPDYVFTWNNGGTVLTGTSFSDLSPGEYQVVVSDQNACSDTISVEINEPTELISEAEVLQDVSCYSANNASAEVSVTGGIAPYTYLWDSIAAYQTTSLATNLLAGNYTVQITDANNCNTFVEVTIEEPDTVLYFDLITTDVSCFGDNDGSASIIANGGTAPYTYVWDQTIGAADTSDVNGIEPGTYLVWISDVNNCIYSQMFSIEEPDQLLYSTEKTDVTCFGGNNGEAIIEVEGGVGPYTYLWSAEADSQTSAIASNLSAGNYSFMINDQNQCVDSGIVSITQPEQVEIQASDDQTVCPNTMITISADASGGVGSYSYFWIDLGQGQEQSLTVVEDQIFQVLAIDSFGCPSEYDTVYIDIINFLNNGLSVGNDGDICLGEETAVYAEFDGNGEMFSYSWNNDLGSDFGPIAVSPIETTTYIFTITDECGNSLLDSTRVNVQFAPQVSINSDVVEGCEPLSVMFDADVDQSNLSYVWNFANGMVSTEASPSVVFDHAGSFNVALNVYSDLGCSADSIPTYTIEVYPTPTSDFSASAWETDVTDATIQFTNTSSPEAVFFTWNFDDGIESMDENPEHTFMNAGIYSVNLETESVNGCISDISKSIIVNPNHDVIVPNAFTPNTSASPGGYYDPTALDNDVFYPFAEFVTDFHMQIFNRWGELIFESKDITLGWDGYYKGQLAPMGGYAYRINLTFYDGYQVKKEGQVKLIK